METTIVGIIQGLYGDNGKEHGNYYLMVVATAIPIAIALAE